MSTGLEALLDRVLGRLTRLQCARDISQEQASGRNIGTKSCQDGNCSGGGEE